MDPIEVFDHKGYRITLRYDEDPRSPDEDKDEALFLVGFHRDFTVERKGFDLRTCRILMGAEEFEEWENGSEYERVKALKKQYHFFGLEAYIHSGVCLALTKEGKFPDRRWDVSQLGVVFVSKKEWPKREDAKKAARGLIKEWNAVMGGDVYGYRIEKPNKCAACGHTEWEWIDACSGYVSDLKACKQAAIDAVEAL